MGGGGSAGSWLFLDSGVGNRGVFALKKKESVLGQYYYPHHFYVMTKEFEA